MVPDNSTCAKLYPCVDCHLVPETVFEDCVEWTCYPNPTPTPNPGTKISSILLGIFIPIGILLVIGIPFIIAKRRNRSQNRNGKDFKF